MRKALAYFLAAATLCVGVSAQTPGAQSERGVTRLVTPLSAEVG